MACRQAAHARGSMASLSGSAQPAPPPCRARTWAGVPPPHVLEPVARVAGHASPGHCQHVEGAPLRGGGGGIAGVPARLHTSALHKQPRSLLAQAARTTNPQRTRCIRRPPEGIRTKCARAAARGPTCVVRASRTAIAARTAPQGSHHHHPATTGAACPAALRALRSPALAPPLPPPPPPPRSSAGRSSCAGTAAGEAACCMAGP